LGFIFPPITFEMNSMYSKVAIFLAVFSLVCGCSTDNKDQSEFDDKMSDQLLEQYSNADSTDHFQVEVQRWDFISTCMSNHGYDYLESAPVATDPEMNRTEPEFRETFGFGVSTTLDALPFSIYAENERIETFERMDGDELQGYQEAEAECAQESYVKLGLPWNGPVIYPEGSEIPEREDNAYEAARQDIRVQESLAGWSACMADSGYQFRSLEDMIGPIEQQTISLREAFINSISLLLQEGHDPESIKLENVLTSEQLETLDQIQSYELEVASVHQTCIDKGYDFETVLWEITLEYLVDEFD